MNVSDHVMTLTEIEARFVSEWVLIEDPLTDANLKVQSGRVIGHSRDRDELYRKAIALRPRRCAVLYTGEIPDDTAVVL